MGTFLSIIGIVSSLLMIKYRERVGENIGEAAWMEKVGGIYNFIIIVSVFIFFWSVAYLTGTIDIFLAPLTFVLGGIIQTGDTGL